jgi:hypothetical protein
MNNGFSIGLAAVLACAALASPAFATDLGNARLTAVTALDGGCVSGPTGPFVQAWDIEPGFSYRLTLMGVTECAASGAGPTLNVRINSTDLGNADLVATWVAPGTYQFTYVAPASVTCTLPIFYCTTPGEGSSGLFSRRADGGSFQAHLRAATFAPGCTSPHEILGPACSPVPNSPRTWGLLKVMYE